MEKLTYEQQYTIRSYEPRPDGHVAITSPCNHLQDIASRHAETLGFGFHDLEATGHVWVLARLHLRMERLPVYGESIKITTWPSANERLVALRDFILEDDNGIIGRGTTSWVVLNLETRRADKPETVLDSRFIPERERALSFPTKAITRLKDGTNSTTLSARRADMDINRHINNVRYVEFCLESIPQEWIESNRCMGVDVQFRAESHPGDVYTSSCSKEDPKGDESTYLHSLIRTSDNKEIVRMRSWWEAV